jgi:L-asparaginase
VYKVRTRGTDAFRGFPRESVALVTPATLDWFGAPWRSDMAAQFAWCDNLPEVAILYAYAGMDPRTLACMLSVSTRSIVMAGVGEGNMSEGVRQELARRASQGLVVVRASRAGEGLVDREREDDANGFVAARALNPQKARILLQLLVANGFIDPAAIQAAFDNR